MRFQLRYKNCSNSLTDKSAPKGGKTGDTLTLRLAQMEIQTALCCQLISLILFMSVLCLRHCERNER